MILDYLPYPKERRMDKSTPPTVQVTIYLYYQALTYQRSKIESLSPDKNCSNGIVSILEGTVCHKSSVPALVSLPVIFTTSPSDPSTTSDIEEDDVEAVVLDEDDDEECEEGSLLLKIVSKLGDNEEVISSA